MKCLTCHRRRDCAYLFLARRTLPFVQDAAQDGILGTDREILVLRAMRGSGDNPGFSEDARVTGALNAQDVKKMAEGITERQAVSLADLVQPCRHYVGPALG